VSNNKMPEELPFWIDDPNPYAKPNNSKFRFFPRITRLIFFISYFGALLLFAWIAVSFPIFWLFTAFQAVFVAFYIFTWRIANKHEIKVKEVQHIAREKTGASLIGSAIHTAGHPHMSVDQPIVLALKDSDISFYTYSNPIPIDTLNVKDIISVDPVIYDDDRIPHIGVVDNTAQSLQIVFQQGGKTYTCLFRRMYKVKPIEWYQAIQSPRPPSLE